MHGIPLFASMLPLGAYFLGTLVLFYNGAACTAGQIKFDAGQPGLIKSEQARPPALTPRAFLRRLAA
jgi:hypothetical protein